LRIKPAIRVHFLAKDIFFVLKPSIPDMEYDCLKKTLVNAGIKQDMQYRRNNAI